MTFYVGIDSSGDTLRLCVTNNSMVQLAFIQRQETSDPAVVGQSLAGSLISTALQTAVDSAYIEPEAIHGVAVGIDTRTREMAAEWLPSLLRSVLPNAVITVTSREEIALVGGRGERYGVLLHAGDGSVAFGVNQIGDTATVGGWGYRIGDEGSAYWLGTGALRAVAMAADKRGISTQLTDAVMNAYDLSDPRDLLNWLYGEVYPRPHQLAEVAPLVMRAAEAGDEVAQKLIEQAAAQLGAHVRTVRMRLDAMDAPVVLSGHLLEQQTPLRTSVLAQLGLRQPPAFQYEPVMGAALLAKLLDSTSADVPV